MSARPELTVGVVLKKAVLENDVSTALTVKMTTGEAVKTSVRGYTGWR